MKIAISGKGGVGKTTIAGVMARMLAQRGKKVLAIDADPDANLASALGFPKEKAGNVTPLVAMTPLVGERTGAKILVGRDEVVIVDMEAGLEHLGRGSTEYVDALVVVVEPGLRSIGTTKQIKKLANDLGVKRVLAVGNKITTAEDRKIIEEHLTDFEILGHLSFNPKILQADRDGVSPYDIDDRIKAEVAEIIERLEAQ